MTQQPKKVYLAADFGGGSGRVIAGWLDHQRLVMEEIHRFGNRQIRMGNHLYWDFLSLFEELKVGMQRAAEKGYAVCSIGIDTWGVDFGLIDKDGNLLGNPVCYRDGRTAGLPEQFFSQCDAQQHYATTGIQVMEINTLFQLYSMQLQDSAQLRAARHLLFLPDLFSYFLTGTLGNEYTIASTSELLDARRRNWSEETLAALQLPRHLFGPLIPPGTVRGELKAEVAQETGLDGVKVIAVGSHDTASAVAAIPATDSSPVAFLSSGTWSLLGVELPEPILSEAARLGQFTNEGGVGQCIRFLQNINGLWILQRLMAEWKARGEEVGYDVLLPAAEKAQIASCIAVDDPVFMNPESMEMAVATYCREHGQAVPEDPAQYVRCVLQSLARQYGKAVRTLNTLLAEPIRVLHIIGGGSQNRLLNQLTANEIGIPVKAGPVEATAMGNLLTQALAMGEVADWHAIREIVQGSSCPEMFYPQG